MPILYLMCGLCFSGKSTAARKLADLRHATLISLDKINEERQLGHGGDGNITQEQWAETHALAVRQAVQRMNSGSDIVIDDTNCFRFLRARWRQIAIERGYKTLIVQVEVPLEEIRRRIEHNAKSQIRHSVRSEVLEDLMERFEWPSPDERTFVLTEKTPIELIPDGSHS